MTKEDIKQICQIYDNFRSERDAATIAYNSDNAFWEHILATYNLSHPSLPSGLDEAAERIVVSLVPTFGQKYEDGSYVKGIRDYFSRDEFIGLVKAGAEWKEQNDKDLSEKIAAAYQLGLADKEKQMMSETVECIVEDWNPEPHPEITIPLNPGKFSNGDRARIIIVKED